MTGEAGGAALLPLACAAVALAAVLITGGVAGVSTARAQAQTAADAAALAAVADLRLVGGSGAPCAAAEAMAAANRAVLRRCAPPGDGRGLRADVAVEVRLALPLATALLPVTASAGAILRPAAPATPAGAG